MHTKEYLFRDYATAGLLDLSFVTPRHPEPVEGAGSENKQCTMTPFDRLRVTLIMLLILLAQTINAQTVWENTNSEVYNYLNRMSQKGLIDFQDIIRPLSRQYIAEQLQELEKKSTLLSNIEKNELGFYLQEFKPIEGSDSDKIHLVKKDTNKRLRGLFINTKDFQLNADPIGGLYYISGSGKSFTQMSNGIQFWGQSKHFGFQFYYRDYTESGTGIDSFRKESPETGIIKLYNPSSKNQNFSEVRASISYSWNNGSISLGKDHLLWGYGENGRIVLSNKAPTYPYIRFDYRPFKWMAFNYTHAWLNSNIVDSNGTYNTGTTNTGTGDIRIQYIPKFMATHTLIFKPIKGLDIALGESIVYSDKIDIGFLIPVNFFKVYDNNRSNYNINAGSNGQFFLQVSSRNHLKKTHLYGSLFIDEIRVSEIFNSAKARNQLGYTIGGSVTDAFISYLTIGGEYTRVNPFVYSNLLPAQFYTQYNDQLGDWMENNFDRAMLFAKFTPLPKLKTYIRYQYIRKGGPGTIAQQYVAVPQPAFLFDYQKNRSDIFFQASYELINNFYLTGSYQYINQELASGTKLTNTTLQVGISYGLK